MKNQDICRIILYSLAYLFLFPATVLARDWEFIRDQYGNVLGAEWMEGADSISGELARHLTRGTFLFIPCKRDEIRYGDQFIRRTIYNCSGTISYWPDNLVRHVQVALSKPVVLTGPPATCGMCDEVPFAEFRLPEGTAIDPYPMWDIEFGTLRRGEDPAGLVPYDGAGPMPDEMLQRMLREYQLDPFESPGGMYPLPGHNGIPGLGGPGVGFGGPGG